MKTAPKIRKVLLSTVLIVITLNVSVIAAAQLPYPLPEVAADVVQIDSYPAQDVTFSNGVRGIPANVYWQPVGYRPLTLDLYLPPNSVERPEAGFPVVIYIHGGGWRAGNTRLSGPFVDFPGLLASLSAKGYVVASIQYRLSGEAKFPAQVQDVQAAIRWLRLNASNYDIDPARVVTWGISAGGHLATLAAVSCKTDAPDTQPDPTTSPESSYCVQGSVAWSGVFNIATMADQAKNEQAMSGDVSKAPEWQLLGCFANECKPEQIAAASPVNYVDRYDPPMLLIVGAEDTRVPPEQTLEMAEKLKLAGVKYNLVVLPGVNHSFMGETPAQTRDANLKALAETFNFIDQTIGNASNINR